MIICAVGDLSDLTFVYLAWTARRMGLEVLELDEGAVGREWAFEFDSDAPEAGILRAGTREIPFSQLAGAYVRLCPQPALPGEMQFEPATGFCFKAERRFGLHVLLEALPCPVANRPSAGRANGSKPLQMGQLQRAGFAVPEWMVGNDPDSVQQFLARHQGAVIYKACSGLRARVRKFDEELRERIGEGTTPVILQEFIAGRDVRVHTVGREAFATQVTGTSGVDYRFEGAGADYRAIELPQTIRELCCEVAERENLLIAGFDFRVTADERWYCLEVNPVPTFLPYEMCGGQPIAATLVRHLVAYSQCFGRAGRSPGALLASP